MKVAKNTTLQVHVKCQKCGENIPDFTRALIMQEVVDDWVTEKKPGTMH